MYYKLRLLFSLVSIFFSAVTLSQRVFHVNLKFSTALDTNKIKIRIDNGRGERRIIPSFKGNQITLTDTFYSRFTYVNCSYPSDNIHYPYSNSFFIGDAPASITFAPSNNDSIKNPLSNCILINAYEIAKTTEAKQLNLFTSVELNDYKEFTEKMGDEFYTDDSLKKIEHYKYKQLTDKQLEFIKRNGSLYYPFWLFRTQLIFSMDADTLLKIYDAAFSQDLKNSFEGKEIEVILKGRLNSRKSRPAPYFKSVDINSKIVDLNSFRGKYVILNFWASWCVPCIAEMPKLKELNVKYTNKLVLISISRDHDINRFKKAVKKNKMEWINIFDDQNIENAYGKKGAIPQVYLINPIGDIIYNNEEEDDYELRKLIDIIKTNL